MKRRGGRVAVWAGGGVVGVGVVTAAVAVATAQWSDSGPAVADPAKIFSRVDAAELFAESSQGTVTGEQGVPAANEWVASGGARVDYAFQGGEDALAARNEVTQAGFLKARHLAHGSIAEYGVLPAGCRLELVHGGDRVSVNDSDVLGDADCWSLMDGLAMKLDERF
ncbi:hypothetical protein GCM10009839_72760 [Catenulispora yoronensis]|uniref:Uncharacterized protein n=1 Tax=Catenulispora yoronensis TaxID=450799 RepID=A0ABN2VD51_9ACTN